jgi:hypothetical protein
MRIAISPAVQDANNDGPLTCLWEIPDGTKAVAIERATGAWELRVLRRGRILSTRRCDSLTDLVAAAVAAHRAISAAH